MCIDTPAESAHLPSDTRAPALARAFVRGALCRTHSGETYDDAALLTTEIVTNAVRHGGAPIDIRIECMDSWVHVSVSDSSPVAPEHVHPGSDDVGGRGIAIVDAVARTWGVHQHPGDGKDVWFDLGPS